MASKIIVFFVLSVGVMQVNSLFFKDILDYLYDEDDENQMPPNFNNLNMNEPFGFGASKATNSLEKSNRYIPESEIERIVEKKMLEFIQNRFLAFPWGGNIQINQHPGHKLPFEPEIPKPELPSAMDKISVPKVDKIPDLKPDMKLK